MKIFQSDYKKTITPLATIALLAVILSVASHQYSQASLTTATEIASDDIRNNAEIQTLDLSTMFATRLEAVDSNLQILSTSPSLRNQEEPEILIDVAQASTEYLTKFYLLRDSEGALVAVSGRNDSDYLYYLGADDQNHFRVPQETLAPYISGVVDIPNSSVKRPIMYISYPIIDPTVSNQADGRNQFRGIVAAAIDLDITRQLADRSTSYTRINIVEILDSDGTILYSKTEPLIGRNILSGELPWTVLDSEESAVNDFIARTVKGISDSGDFSINGIKSTLVSEPVIVNGEHLWTVIVIAPHSLSSDIGDLFNQQSFFSGLSLSGIASVTVIIGLIIISWNKKLTKIIADRTVELRNVNESLTESNARLTALNEHLSANDKLQQEFINIASHEMKTPTQAILFHSELLKKQLPDSTESLRAVVRNAERLQRLTNNILDVTKIESQNLKLNKEEFNLRDVISEVVSEYGEILRYRTANSFDGELRILCQADDAIVRADKSRITQVLSNLLANAAEFTKEGKIIVSCERKEDEFLVKVKDSGPGIDPEIVSRLFTKFATASDKGTGLGLFVSKSIIEAHGGKMWAESHNGQKGATFGFTLPAIKLD